MKNYQNKVMAKKKKKTIKKKTIVPKKKTTVKKKLTKLKIANDDFYHLIGTSEKLKYFYGTSFKRFFLFEKQNSVSRMRVNKWCFWKECIVKWLFHVTFFGQRFLHLYQRLGGGFIL